MKTVGAKQIDTAEEFVWLSGRLLERLRFAFLFRDGSRERALSALRPYQNPDGGFGEALEPDFRGPISEPETAYSGLRVLDELDAFDDPMVARACDYLVTITTSEGGLPAVLRTWSTTRTPDGGSRAKADRALRCSRQATSQAISTSTGLNIRG